MEDFPEQESEFKSAGAKIGEAVRKGSLSDQVFQQEKIIAQLNDGLLRLEKRISAVLRPEEPSPTAPVGPSASEPAPLMAGLTSHIESNNRQLRKAFVRLSQMTGRVDL